MPAESDRKELLQLLAECESDIKYYKKKIEYRERIKSMLILMLQQGEE